MALGYDKNLYLLAFDHRASFSKNLFGISGEPTPEESARVTDAKWVIYEGFVKATGAQGISDEEGILVDEHYGADIARTASAAGAVLAMPVEKSGQAEFDFEYGEAFGEHILSFDPEFSKVLVRYNPDDDKEMNARQAERLKRLGDWLHERDRKFLFELLVPATKEQLDSLGGDTDRYDLELRPALMVRAIGELQDAGVEADIWKIEGIDKAEDCEAIAKQARRDGRDGVACIVLGRGAESDKVDHWLRVGAATPGYRGFAIGRTMWWDALAGWRDGNLDREKAVNMIAERYRRAIDVYRSAVPSTA
jgi:myo-inositol catabolism protein IolC